MNKKGNVIIGLALSALMLSGVAYAAQQYGTNAIRLFVERNLGVGVNSGAARFTAKSDGTNDIVSLQNSSGIEVLEVSAAGALTVSDAFFPEQVTADPCAATGYGPGAMFWNSTSGYMCYCDASTDDLKMVDNSTACF